MIICIAYHNIFYTNYIGCIEINTTCELVALRLANKRTTSLPGDTDTKYIRLQDPQKSECNTQIPGNTFDCLISESEARGSGNTRDPFSGFFFFFPVLLY